MALPISEQIAVKVRTRLGLISTDNGYEVDVAGVYRPNKVAQFHPENYQVIVTQGDVSMNEELSHPGNPPATAWDLPFEIAGILRISDTNTTSLATHKNVFWADVVKALTDATAWYNWDQLAINSIISDVADYQDTDGNSGFKLTLKVTFRTDETNPYNVRA